MLSFLSESASYELEDGGSTLFLSPPDKALVSSLRFKWIPLSICISKWALLSVWEWVLCMDQALCICMMWLVLHSHLLQEGLMSCHSHLSFYKGFVMPGFYLVMLRSCFWDLQNKILLWCLDWHDVASHSTWPSCSADLACMQLMAFHTFSLEYRATLTPFDQTSHLRLAHIPSFLSNLVTWPHLCHSVRSWSHNKHSDEKCDAFLKKVWCVRERACSILTFGAWKLFSK